MKKLFQLSVLTIIVCFSWSSSIAAEFTPKCSGIQAIYEPFTKTSNDFVYDLIVRNVEDKKIGITDTIFTLNFYRSDTKKLLASIDSSYGCTNGIPDCSLSAGPHTQLAAEFFKKDFSVSSVTEGPAPYAIVIPHIKYVYINGDWDRSKIEPYLKTLPPQKRSSTKPELNIPERWVFKKCR